MKFRFKNLGPIKEANLELGDLTIIAGPNNTGKTYLAYALYGFLKRWEWSPEAIVRLMREKGLAGIGSMAAAALYKGQASVRADRHELEEQRATVGRYMDSAFSKSELAQMFSSTQDRFKDASVEMSSALPEDIPTAEMRESSGTRFRVSWEDDQVLVSVDAAPGQYMDRGPALFFLEMLYFRFLFPELKIEPFILCSERFGISLFYRELDFTKNKLVDLLQQMSDERSQLHTDPFLVIDRTTSRYALPVKDNIDYTRSIPDLRGQKSALSEHKLATELRRLTSASYKSSGDSISLTSTARGPRRFSIPLHLASSSARGLSDLYFFLQHVAGPNHLLIIDEPESHLDTHNQILMARLLVRCVHAGLKVLITTHSDYLVKELNNLIMLSRDLDGKQDLLKKLKYDTDDALDPGRIRAYVAENGTLTACNVDKYGMEMPNFDSTIDDINHATNEISSRILETEGE
ncbi:MAG: AAA family ATPase [Spirochaetaceae bacterium]|nr:AAA family ATPase [Spirochaetaceae bacterium]